MEPVSFINNHLKYNSPTKGQTNFKLYPFQEELVNKFHTNQRNIFCSSRQSGKTIVPLYYLLNQALFNPESNILILGLNKETSCSLINIIKYACKSITDPWPMKLALSSTDKLEFHNGSKIYASSALNVSEITMHHYTHVFLDEFAFIPFYSSEEIWIRLNCIKETSKVIIGSTKHKDSFFNNILMNAAKGSNDFVASVYDWYFVPSRGEMWKRETISMIGADAFEHEYQMTL